MEFYKERKIDENEEFLVFAKEIDDLSEFLELFSDLIVQNGHNISFCQNGKYFSVNTTLIDSASKTIKSIKLCCSIGSFSDANTLIRKLRDDLLQYVYILIITVSRQSFRPESARESIKETLNLLSRLPPYDTLSEDEEAVKAWFENKVEELNPRKKRMKLDFENYMNVFRKNEKINKILKEFGLDHRWNELSRNLNNYVHNNGVKYSKHNIIDANNNILGTHLNEINNKTSYIVSVFVVLIILTKSDLIASTDYMDHVELEREPIENSQYFIANGIQEFIDTKISKIHPELIDFLKRNNTHSMIID